MSKLLQRLKDPGRSGVYRASRAEDIEEVTRGSPLSVARVSLGHVARKDAMLERIAGTLAFPDWFGRNWDALEDCLTDLSWREAEGHVLVFEDFAQSGDLGILIDVLAASAEFWASRRKPFFAVFLDPNRNLDLAELYRDAPR